MGYDTDFTGVLTFTEELKASDITFLNNILGEDFRDHPEWPQDIVPKDVCWIKLRFTYDFSGLVWSEVEKTYNMLGCINFIIDMMTLRNPNFGLEGTLLAQGEEMDDRYEIRIVNGRAEQKELPVLGDRITCPHCKGTFILK